MTAAVALFTQNLNAAPAAERRGVMAFDYRRSLTPAELAWYGQFDLLVTHDPLPRAHVDALHARGTRLLLYEWSVAFYPSIAGTWHRALPRSALLNARPLRGHAGSLDADAYYYDPVSPQHVRERAPVLAAKLRAAGYDGLFFDTTSSESVHPEALAEFTARHPDVTYDVAFARFLRALRRELKEGVIVTNQGYRAAAHILPFVDYDVSESLITRPVKGRYVLRPWYDPGDEWNSISFLMRKLIAPVQREYPRVRFVHLNYLETLDQAAIARIVAIARIYGAEAFVAQPSISGGTLGDAYFADLGAPRPRVESTAKRTAYRFFARGLAAANFGTVPLSIPNEARATYENVATRETTRARRIVVAPGTAVLFRRR
ncbi:MAG TPA: hypothetical protein VGF69_16460 [Thermoanaerobaculia bacterium]